MNLQEERSDAQLYLGDTTLNHIEEEEGGSSSTTKTSNFLTRLRINKETTFSSSELTTTNNSTRTPTSEGSWTLFTDSRMLWKDQMSTPRSDLPPPSPNSFVNGGGNLLGSSNASSPASYSRLSQLNGGEQGQADQLASFLARLSLEKYHKVFLEHEIDWEALTLMQEKQFSDLKIPMVRNDIYMHIDISYFWSIDLFTH